MVVVPRQTRQRAEILDLLEDVDEFRSAQQLHEMLRARGSSVGLATVYRAVQSLSEHGDVDVLRTQDGESVYRRCEQRSHHHHLVCRSCGRTVEIEAGQAEAWAAQVGAAHGFDDVDHTIELVGTCATCRAPPRPDVVSRRGARRACAVGSVTGAPGDEPGDHPPRREEQHERRDPDGTARVAGQDDVEDQHRAAGHDEGEHHQARTREPGCRR